MAWGVIDPSDYGDFFPQGDYVGWKEKLKAHWDNAVSTETKDCFIKESAREGLLHMLSAFAFVGYKFVSEQGQRKSSGSRHSSSIAQHEWPQEFRTVFPSKSLGSLIMLHGFMVAVDTALKAIIERVEPGAHTFSPIRIGQLGADSTMSTYFVLVIGQFRQSFSPELSSEGAWQEKLGGNFKMAQKTKKAMAGFALSKAAIGSAHLWRERKVYEPKIFLSDMLEAEIAEAGLRSPPLRGPSPVKGRVRALKCNERKGEKGTLPVFTDC